MTWLRCSSRCRKKIEMRAAADPCPSLRPSIQGSNPNSPSSGTNRTSVTVLRADPSRSCSTSVRIWLARSPSGMTIRPPGASCSTSGAGTRGGRRHQDGVVGREGPPAQGPVPHQHGGIPDPGRVQRLPGALRQRGDPLDREHRARRAGPAARSGSRSRRRPPAPAPCRSGRAARASAPAPRAARSSARCRSGAPTSS